MRFIIVGTMYSTVPRWSCDRGQRGLRVERGSSTTWLPAQQRLAAPDAGAVVVERPGHDEAAVVAQQQRRRVHRCRSSAGSPDTISFGRPVLPPEVGAFHAGEIEIGEVARIGLGARKPIGTQQRPSIEPSGTPTTADGFASSMIASNSRWGRRHEIGCGMAPSRHVAR
jgi:hypothetical protein